MAEICFFIGHRETGEEILPSLEAAVERHIAEYGVTEFVVGGYGGFDRMAALAVRSAKKRHPSVTLVRLLPYHPAERAISLEGFDGSLYPPGMETVPRRFAIPRANRWMVDHSGYLIACAQHPASNAWELTAYARRREEKGLIRVTNLYESASG